MSRPVRLFISYAQKDQDLRDQLETHLSLLKRQKLIDSWTDRPLLANQEFQGVIDERLEQADIVMLLLSPSFLASSYCYEGEMARAMALHQSGEIRVIPVLARSADITGAPFSALQGLPSNGTPISKWRDQDEAWLNVVQGLRQVVNTMKDRPPRQPAVAAPVQPPPQQTPAAPDTGPPPDRYELLEQLERIPGPVFQKVIFYSKVSPAELPPQAAPQSERAMALIQHFEAHGEKGVLTLASVIRQALRQR